MMDDLRNPAIRAALDDALARGDRRLLELLCRHSGLPGPRPNEPLARAVAQVAATGRDAAVDALVRDLIHFDIERAPAGTDREYLPFVAAFILSARRAAGRQGAPSAQARNKASADMAALALLAEDSRHLVRDGVMAALADLISLFGDTLCLELVSWMDGYLPAAVVLGAVTQRKALDTIRSADSVVGLLDQAFDLAENAPRAHQRSQGYRTLVRALAERPSHAIDRFATEVLDWLALRAKTESPDLREALEAVIDHARRAGHSIESFQGLQRALGASAAPRRDPTTYVGPTRQRGGRARRTGRHGPGGGKP